MADVLITGGDVIDGTGSARRRADVALSGDRITAIGDLSSMEAARTIDATGRLVTPGFVDVHTHVDAQAFWDTTLSPSPLHGVTTVIGGNCGFTIAPLGDDPAHGDYLMRMLARVEGMPLEALQEGVPWNWSSTAEYLDAMDNTLSINAGFKIGHSALRRVVMGDDCVKRAATAEEITAMQDLLRLGLEAGGLGFSSSWSRTHNDANGNMVPSRYAEREELISLCSVLADYEGTSVEFIPAVAPFEDWAIELMADMSVAAQSQLNWNVLNVTARSFEQGMNQLRAGDVAAERGGRVVALTAPMTLALRLNFDSGFVLDAMPDWEHVMLLPKEEKKALLADPVQRKALNERAQAPDNKLRGLAHWRNKVLFHTDTPEFTKYIGRTIGEMADEIGKEPWDALVDLALEDDLVTSFGNPPSSETSADWEARAQIWRDDRAMIGASDAGAHLDLFISAHYATEVLGKAVRQEGLLSTEEAIHRLTDIPARLYGLHDRGRLTEGSRADVVVLNEATMGAGDIELRTDLPAGGTRLYVESTGVDHVLCNGVEVVDHGSFTAERPGRIVRRGTDTTGSNLS